MAPQVDLVIVVGSQNSSNSNRLREVAENNWIEAYMVDNATQIDLEKVNLLPFVSFGHTSIWNKGCNG
jgi:4-hydroxy-3-methylbut-2-enyl diphosphate reductase IspH